MKRKVGLFYFHVASNIGDLAINEGVQEIFSRFFNKEKIEIKTYILDGERSPHLSTSLSFDDDPVYINAKNATPFSAISEDSNFFGESFNELDLIIINSGEHYFQYASEENFHSLFWRLLPALAARKKNIPTIFFPSTVGPLETASSKAILSSFLSVCDKIYIRDSESFQYVHHFLELPSETLKRIDLVLDPAFYLNFQNKSCSFSGASKHEAIALVMRLEDWGIRIDENERKAKNKKHVDENFVNSVAFKFSVSLIDKIIETTEKKIYIFTQTLADKKLNLALEKKYQNTGRVIHFQPKSIEEYLDKLNSVDEIVASRFHALILGMVVGKFPIGVYFDQHGHKMPGLFGLLGISDFIKKLTHKNTESTAVEIFNYLLQDKTKISAGIEKKIGQLKSQFERSLGSLDETLNIDSYPDYEFENSLIYMSSRLGKDMLNANVLNPNEPCDDELEKLKNTLKSIYDYLARTHEPQNANLFTGINTVKSEEYKVRKTDIEKKLDFSLSFPDSKA